MHLAIDPLIQNRHDDCGITCLRMVLAYYGEQTSSDEIERFIQTAEDGTTYLTELARYACSRNYNVECLAYNLFLTDPRARTGSPPELLRRLRCAGKNLPDEWFRGMLTSTIHAVQGGVRYTVVKPCLSMIMGALHHGIPPIVTVSEAALYERQGDPFVSHDVLVIGFEAKKVIFIDPAMGQRDSVEWPQFYFALLSRKITSASAYMLLIERMGAIRKKGES